MKNSKSIISITSIALLALTGCSTTNIKQADIDTATFNSAQWKSQAGVGQSATIEATTSPKTDASLTGL